jgi:uncharacterized protein (TIGR02996 family)
MSPLRPPRPEVAAFLADIRDDPDDDTPRLILADWLEEHGDEGDRARAELIRVQVERARLSPNDPRQPELRQREEHLILSWRLHWSGPLAGRVRFLNYHRGTVALTVTCPMLRSPSLLALQQTEEWAWVVRLEIVEVTHANGARLTSCPLIADVAELSLRGPVGGPEHTVWALTFADSLARLVRLRLSGGGDRLRFLVNAHRLLRLRELDLTGNNIGNGGTQVLAGAHLPALSSLSLARNIIGDTGARELAASPHLGGLHELDLSDNRLTDETAFCLARSPHLKNLTRLVLWGNPITTAGAAELRQRFGDHVFLSAS